MRKVTITVMDSRFDDTELTDNEVEHVVNEMFKGGVYLPDEHMASVAITAEKAGEVVSMTRAAAAAAAMVGMIAASLLAAIADDSDFILGLFQVAGRLVS